MPLRFPGLVKAQTSTSGTGTYTISEPGQAGWRTFTRAVSDGDLAHLDSVAYIVTDTTVTNGPNLFEICVGVWDNTAKTLTRGQVYQPGGAVVSWGVGTRDVVVIDNPVLFLLLAGGTMTGVLNILLSGAIITPSAETGLVVQRSASADSGAGVSIISKTAGKSRLNLGDTADEDAGGWYYDNNIDALIARTNGNDRSFMDSAGVWKTAAGAIYDAFPSTTTKLVFYMASAPTGWTKDTSNTDAALRVVSGSGGGTGGSKGLSATEVDSHTLQISEIPAHVHQIGADSLASSGGTANSPVSFGAGTNKDTSSVGGSDGHTHGLALKYIDVIVAAKN